MDWKPFMSGLIAVTASAVTAGAVLYGQVISQEHENIRHLRALAYQSALEEWRVKVETIRETKCYEQLPHFSDVLLKHIEYSYVIQKYGAGAGSDPYAGPALDLMLENFQNRQNKLLKSPEDSPGQTNKHPGNGRNP